MGAIRIGLRHERWSANSQEFLGLDDAMGLARFLCRSGGELAEGEMKRTNCMYPRTEARCPSPARRRRSVCLLASVVAGRREQSKLAAPAAAAASSGSELQLFGEGGRRHHRHAGGGADHAVVHPRWADGRAASGDGPAEEPVVEAGARAGAVVAERARGGVVVEVADLRRVVVVPAHGGERRVRVPAGGGAAGREEGDRPGGEEVLRGGVRAGAGGVAPAGAGAAPSSAAAAVADPLHALEVEAVLLEVRRNVLAREAIDAHQLHYRLGDGVLDAEVRHRVDEPLVQLRRPHEPGPLERPRRLVATSPAAAAAARPGRRRRPAVHLPCPHATATTTTTTTSTSSPLAAGRRAPPPSPSAAAAPVEDG